MKTTAGISALREGFELIKRPEVRLYVALPLLINALVFGGLIWWSIGQIGAGIEWLLALVPDWLAWLDWLLWPLAVLMLVLACLLLFSAVANVIAAPFNGLLAEKIEALLTGRSLDEGASVMSTLKQAPRIMVKEAQKLGYQLKWLPLLILVMFIPVLNLLSPLLWFLYNAWMAAIEYIDYPMDNHQHSFAEVKSCVSNARLPCLLFGGAVTGLMMVPLVNLLVMPAAVCAATKLWVEDLSAANV